VKASDHQEVSDIAKLRIHEYFDRYLTDVFPKQMKGLFEKHNMDVAAHQDQFAIHEKTCRPGRKLSKVMWMCAGGTAVISAAATLGIERVLKLLGLV
jgi:hypothetical protein